MSISRVGRTELKKKLFNTVLLVGGGANMHGMVGSLEDRLIHKLEGMQTEQVRTHELTRAIRVRVRVGFNANYSHGTR